MDYKLSKKEGTLNRIGVISPFPSLQSSQTKIGSDNLAETIEANLKCVKQKILSLAGNETECIKVAPALRYLVKM